MQNTGLVRIKAMLKSKRSLAGPSDLASASVPKKLYASKKENGRVLIIGGSKTFHGAPVMASNAAMHTLAALRVGAGYVITCVPKGIVGAVRKLSPNIIVKSLKGDSINPRDLPFLKKEIMPSDSVVIGPGIGRSEESLRAVAELISCAIKLKKRLVLDADAIYAIKFVKGKLGQSTILTPHDKEFMQLSGTVLNKTDLPNRSAEAVNLSKKLDSVLLLKGHETIITDGRSIKIVRSRTAALATMGTGDVLSGIIGGYAARNADCFADAVAGAYLHSRIGDMLFKEKGYHIIASDIIEKIPLILKRFDKTEQG